MEKDIKSLICDVKPKKAFISDAYGQTFSSQEYIEYFHSMVAAKQEANLIPKLYEKPIGAQLELTYKCNQKCIHCYNQSGMENSNNPQLSLDEWKAIAHQLGKMGIFQCVISGGEPTLMGEGLFEIMDILHEYGVIFVVITNGMLINEENIKRFAKYRYSWFQVSIDGSRPELHNYIRGTNAFDKAIKAADLVKRAGLPLVIAHAVMKKNIGYLEEMIDLAYRLGAMRVVAGPFSYMGRAVLNSEDIELTDDEIVQAYEIIDKKALEYSGRMEVSIPSEEAISLRIRLAEPNGVMLFRPNGDVKFDCVSPFKIGNIKENSLEDIWEIGRKVYSNERLINYIMKIKTHEDLLTTYPRINVDPDELLV